MPQSQLIRTDTETTDNTTFICSICIESHHADEMHEFDGKTLCNHCYDNETVLCDSCHERTWYDHSYCDDDIYLCSSCYENYYRRCNSCDCLVHDDDVRYYDDNPYCRRCYNEIDTDGDDDYDENPIHSYNYKPEPIFHGEGIHYGVELEVDDAGEDNSKAQLILDIGNYGDEHIYIKHDGSLSNGFEIVSHPMSLHYHQNDMNWRKVLEKLIKLGYLSHKTDTCGYHIHIERNALGRGMQRQEETISNILYFVEKHWHELLKFSRRTPDQIEKWAARYGYKDSPQEILYHAKTGRFGRYVCVNLQNTNTIEFRMFRGTLKYSTFIATLQIVNEICNVALSLDEEALKALTWMEFVRGIDRYKCSELVEYLRYKNLYVNDPISEDVEEDR